MNTRKMYPKKPPCTQYKGTQILYTRNKKKFCRTKTRFAKKKILSEKKTKTVSQSITSSDEDINGLLFCKRQNKETLSEWADIFSIPSKDIDKIPMKICTQLELWKRAPEPNMDMLNIVAKNLKLSIGKYNDDKIKIKKAIEKKIYKHMTPTFKKIIGDSDVPVNYIITLIYNILIPDKFSVHTKLDISEKMYKQLVEDKKKGILDIDKEGILNNSMKRKFDHCTNKLKFINKFFTKITKDISKPYRNPEGVCYTSIYKK